MLQNELIQLIQYSPSTEEVYEGRSSSTADGLNKQNRLRQMVVEQGFTVFLVLWSLCTRASRRRPLRTICARASSQGSRPAARSGRANQCAWLLRRRTLLASTLAYTAAEGDDRIASASFLAAQVDFSEACYLLIFISNGFSAELVEEMMAEQAIDRGRTAGPCPTHATPGAIDLALRRQQLCLATSASRLCFWNAEGTRLPAANHAFTPRGSIICNWLSRPTTRAGELHLGRVTFLIYDELATKESHIAPPAPHRLQAVRWTGAVRTVGSGHIVVPNAAAGEEISILVGRQLRLPY